MHGVRYWYIYAEYNMADLKAHMPQLHYDILFFLPTPFRFAQTLLVFLIIFKGPC